MTSDHIGPNQHAVFSEIGMFVVISQSLERIIRTVLFAVVQGDEPLNGTNFAKKEKEIENKTLGFLIQQLRKRADFNPILEITFTRYVANRNRLIHSFGDVPGSNMENAEDIARVRTFLAQNFDDYQLLLRFFIALIYSWGKQMGPRGERLIPPDLMAKLEDLHPFANVVPIIDQLVFCKSWDR